MNRFNNFSNIPTITVSKAWSLLDNDSKIEQISFHINAFNKNKLNIKVVSADNKGQVIIALHENMPPKERGIFLLDLENYLKENIDSGINIWCEPIGDKNKLRKLRGIEINT